MRASSRLSWECSVCEVTELGVEAPVCFVCGGVMDRSVRLMLVLDLPARPVGSVDPLFDGEGIENVE